jgi:hypothetical protein
MSARLRPFAVVALALLPILSPPLLAQERDNLSEVKKLELLLSVINTEIKSELDQILLLQEAIRANNRISLEESGRSPDSVTVEEAVAAQRRAIQREATINARLDAILARNAELAAKKKQLIDRIEELHSN